MTVTTREFEVRLSIDQIDPQPDRVFNIGPSNRDDVGRYRITRDIHSGQPGGGAVYNRQSFVTIGGSYAIFNPTVERDHVNEKQLLCVRSETLQKINALGCFLSSTANVGRYDPFNTIWNRPIPSTYDSVNKKFIIAAGNVPDYFKATVLDPVVASDSGVGYIIIFPHDVAGTEDKVISTRIRQSTTVPGDLDIDHSDLITINDINSKPGIYICTYHINIEDLYVSAGITSLAAITPITLSATEASDVNCVSIETDEIITPTT